MALLVKSDLFAPDQKGAPYSRLAELTDLKIVFIGGKRRQQLPAVHKVRFPVKSVSKTAILQFFFANA